MPTATIEPADWHVGLCFIAEALDSIGLACEARRLRNVVSPGPGVREVRRAQSAADGAYQALLAAQRIFPVDRTPPEARALHVLYERAQTAANIGVSAWNAADLCQAAADAALVANAML